MGTKYLIDTNVLIDAQMGRLSENSMRFLAKVVNENFIVSFITYIEFLGYKNVPKLSEDFIKLAYVIEIDKLIINDCIRLRKMYNIKLPDAIIAATAITYNYILITNNEKDFVNMEGLEVLNLYKL